MKYNTKGDSLALAAALIVVILSFIIGGIWLFFEWGSEMNGGSYKPYAAYTSADGNNHISI